MNISASGVNLALNFGANRSTGGNGFNNNKVYSSLAQMTSALYAVQDSWRDSYTSLFAGGEAMTVDELKEFMGKEFGGYGVTFVDYNPADVVGGKHLVYIDETNLARMAQDPAYRAENLALMQREFSGIGGCTIQDARGTSQFALTGTVFSLAEENPEVGGSRYRGMARSDGWTVGASAEAKGGSKSKSMLEIMAERLEEIREKALAKKDEQARLDEAAARRKELFSENVTVTVATEAKDRVAGEDQVAAIDILA